MKRKRFTIRPELLMEAEEYCKLDNRTFSELVCEAIQQHMRRYPKKQKAPQEAFQAINDRLGALAEMIATKVLAGTRNGNGRKVRD